MKTLKMAGYRLVLALAALAVMAGVPIMVIPLITIWGDFSWPKVVCILVGPFLFMRGLRVGLWVGVTIDQLRKQPSISST